MSHATLPLWRQALERMSRVAAADHLADAERAQTQAWSGEPMARVPVVATYVQDPDWPLFPFAEAFDDPEKMFWNELSECYSSCRIGDDRPLTIRPNYGPGVVASLFGAPTRITGGDRAFTEALPHERIEELLRQDVPDVRTDLGGRVLRTARLFVDWLQEYPALRGGIHVYCCDNQGPFDTTHLIMGAGIYYAVVDDPSAVHALLTRVTAATQALIRAQKQIIGETSTQGYHRYYKMRAGLGLWMTRPSTSPPPCTAGSASHTTRSSWRRSAVDISITAATASRTTRTVWPLPGSARRNWGLITRSGIRRTPLRVSTPRPALRT